MPRMIPVHGARLRGRVLQHTGFHPLAGAVRHGIA